MKYDVNDGFGNFKVTKEVYHIDSKSDVKGASLANVIIALFSVVLLILVTCSIFRGGDSITFTGFLQFLSEQGTNFAMTSMPDYSIVGDWGLFNFLRDFLNIFIMIMNVAIYVCKFAWNVLMFIFGFVQFCFGF